MRVTCPSCQATYNLDERRIPPGGAKLKCTKCQTIFPIEGGVGPEAVPLPGGAPPEAPRRPADGGSASGPGVPTTGSRPMPVPVSMTTGVIPLPSLGLGGNQASIPQLTPHAP